MRRPGSPAAALALSLLLAPLFGTPAAGGTVGTEGASFLDIPVGAGPAALGSAYSARASDAYAPTWNPAGLAHLDSVQAAAQHLAYVQSTHYEYLSLAVPIAARRDCQSSWACGRSGVGGSVQYFGSGDIGGLDPDGQPTEDFSNYYAAFNLSYGRALGDRISLGVTGKFLQAQLADVSARAYAVDLGSLYRAGLKWRLAATLMNLGNRLTFLNEGDPLPQTLHLGVHYQASPAWGFVAESAFPRAGPARLGMGAEWRLLQVLRWRAGFRTDNLRGLSPAAGFSVGLGLLVWGQELSYAWLPMGSLGNAQYLSLVMRFGDSPVGRRNLIRYKPVRHSTRPSSAR